MSLEMTHMYTGTRYKVRSSTLKDPLAWNQDKVRKANCFVGSLSGSDNRIFLTLWQLLKQLLIIYPILAMLLTILVTVVNRLKQTYL